MALTGAAASFLCDERGLFVTQRQSIPAASVAELDKCRRRRGLSLTLTQLSLVGSAPLLYLLGHLYFNPITTTVLQYQYSKVLRMEYYYYYYCAAVRASKPMSHQGSMPNSASTAHLSDGRISAPTIQYSDEKRRACPLVFFFFFYQQYGVHTVLCCTLRYAIYGIDFDHLPRLADHSAPRATYATGSSPRAPVVDHTRSTVMTGARNRKDPSQPLPIHPLWTAHGQ